MLPSGVCAYTLRHSVITDLIRDGLPVLTVALLSGTSVAMIERHYGHLVRGDAEQALARLTL
jgi:integrase